MDSSGDGGDEGAGGMKPESPAPASVPAACGGAGRKPTVKRVMKTPYQLVVLEKTYADDLYPNETLRAELSVKLGLTDRQLQMWFCHRRLKDRKLPANRQQLEEEVAVAVIAPPPVLPPSLPHSELTGVSAGTYAEQLLPLSRRGSGRSSAVPRISVLEIGRRYYQPPQVMLPPLAPMHLTRAERWVIDSVQELIGEPLREDGPMLGVEFDPLPPGAFGAPIVPEQQKQPFQSYETFRHDLKLMKLGGINSLLQIETSPAIPLVSKVPTIILGMDVSHGSPGQSDIPSIAANCEALGVCKHNVFLHMVDHWILLGICRWSNFIPWCSSTLLEDKRRVGNRMEGHHLVRQFVDSPKPYHKRSMWCTNQDGC